MLINTSVRMMHFEELGGTLMRPPSVFMFTMIRNREEQWDESISLVSLTYYKFPITLITVTGFLITGTSCVLNRRVSLN